MNSIRIALTAMVGIAAAASPAQAMASGSYTASLATPLSQARQEIVDGVLWKCSEDRCAAPAKGSRPVLVCARVAKAFGPVARFATPEGDLSPDDLTRCNAAK